MPPKARPKLARFLEKVDFATDGCWLWTAALGRGGYPFFDGKAAHRYAYEALVGPIPQGMTLDHTCHNNSGCAGGDACLHRRCVNPEHLEPVDGRTNTLRSPTSTGGRNARKTHCLRGHLLSGENIYARDGKRQCRRCLIERQRERRARVRLADPPQPRELAEFCKRGHPRTPENVDANRRCKLCRRAIVSRR